MEIRGKLAYDHDSNRWIFDSGNSCCHELHCGESFKICIAGKWLPCRLELGSQWYVIFKDASFNLKISQEYLVMIS